jgi:hypothetical protein
MTQAVERQELKLYMCGVSLDDPDYWEWATNKRLVVAENEEQAK